MGRSMKVLRLHGVVFVGHGPAAEQQRQAEYTVGTSGWCRHGLYSWLVNFRLARMYANEPSSSVPPTAMKAITL